MTPLLLVSGAFVSLAFALLVTPFVIRYAWSRQCLDRPDAKRKRHRLPTPTLGGVAIVLGSLAGGLYLAGLQLAVDLPIESPPLGVWVGACIILGVGLFDDLRGLNPKAKFTLQLLVAYLLLHAGYSIDLSGFSFLGDDPYRLALFSIPLTVVWIVGIINAVNLLDGLDGLASGVAMIAFAGLAAIFGMQGDVGTMTIGLLMIGALGGFLVYNFNPASIFMGDSGSLFLGYVLAAYSLDLTAHADPTVALLIPVVLLGIPILDTTVAIARRFLSGKAIFAPDHDHIHHRMRQVFSHRGTVALLYCTALWFAVAAFLMASHPAYLGYGIFGVTLITSALGLHLLGYLRTRAVVRGWRYRRLMSQRQQAAEVATAAEVDEAQVPVVDSLRPAKRTERTETSRRPVVVESTTPKLRHAEP